MLHKLMELIRPERRADHAENSILAMKSPFSDDAAPIS